MGTTAFREDAGNWAIRRGSQAAAAPAGSADVDEAAAGETAADADAAGAEIVPADAEPRRHAA